MNRSTKADDTAYSQSPVDWVKNLVDNSLTSIDFHYINCLIIVLTLSRILCCFIVKVTTDAIRRFLDKPQMTDYCAM